MRALFLLVLAAPFLAALWSKAAMAGEIVILEHGPGDRTRAPHHADQLRGSIILHDPWTGDRLVIIERRSPDGELGRHAPGREARRAARKARQQRTKESPPLPLEAETLFSPGRGGVGQDAARAAGDAHRTRTDR